MNLDILDLVEGGVHLGDDVFGSVGEVGRELIVDGHQLLAVAAPRRVELDEHALGLVVGNLFEVLADEHLDRLSVPVGGYVLGEEVGSDLLVEEVLHELLDDDGAELARLRLVLGHVLGERDETQRGRVLALQTEELEHALVLVLVAVDEHEDDLAAELGRRLLELAQHRVELARLLAHEQQVVDLDVTAEDLLGSLLVELDDERKLVGVDELAQVLLDERSVEDALALVELLEENDGAVAGDLELVEERLLGRDGEAHRVDLLGHVGVELGALARRVLEQADDDHLGLVAELGQLVAGRDGHGRRSGLLLHPLDDLVGRAATAVLERRLVGEELERRVAADLEAFAELRVHGGVDFAELYLAAVDVECAGRLGVLGRERLAVAAPRRVELDEQILVRLDGLVEVLLREHEHVVLLFDGGGRRRRRRE